LLKLLHEKHKERCEGTDPVTSNGSTTAAATATPATIASSPVATSIIRLNFPGFAFAGAVPGAGNITPIFSNSLGLPVSASRRSLGTV